jgi:hypothetical protein
VYFIQSIRNQLYTMGFEYDMCDYAVAIQIAENTPSDKTLESALQWLLAHDGVTQNEARAIECIFYYAYL